MARRFRAMNNTGQITRQLRPKKRRFTEEMGLCEFPAGASSPRLDETGDEPGLLPYVAPLRAVAANHAIPRTENDQSWAMLRMIDQGIAAAAHIK